MKPQLILAVIMLAIGLVAGLFIGPSVRDLQQKQQLASLSQTTNVAFDRCRDLDATQAKSCADSLIVEDALRKQDRVLCASISDLSVQKDCAARVERLAKLGDVSQWCKGVGSDSVCVDVATILSASESHDISKCNVITVPALLTACVDLITGASANTSSAVAVARAFQFGYSCDQRNTYCLNDVRTFLAAVNTQNAKLCDEFTADKNLCLQEVATYTAYKADNNVACKSAPNQQMCEYNVVLAKALDASDPKACSALDAKAVQGCQDFVKITKEKRFAYLSQTL